MKRITAFCRAYSVDGIWWIGCAMTLAVTLMRIFITPLTRDPETGNFGVSMVVVTVALLAVAVMAALARLGDDRRVELREEASTPVAAVSVAAGALIGIGGIFDLLGWFIAGTVPPPQTAMTSALPVALLIITGVLAAVSGVVLCVFGRQLWVARRTRAGMATWEMLVPVLWMWFRLTRYMMSYASAVGLDECIYDFGMFVTELLFVFRFARYISGIGKTTVSDMLAYAMSTAVWTLSAVLTRLCMYVLGDTQAYLASRLAGLSDLAVGAFALIFAAMLWHSARYSDDSSDDELSDEEPSSEVSDAVIDTMEE